MRHIEEPIFGTTFFDGQMAAKGYGLNKMCFSFNHAENREAFKKDEEAYYDKYGLTEAQKEAVRTRCVLDMIAEGGNIYYLAKLSGMLGLSVQDVGAQMTGKTVDEFKQMLVDAGK